MRSKKLFIILSILCLICVALVFGTLKKSPIYNFPVPIIAQIDQEHSQDNISYRFIGINRLYIQHVKLLGWKEVDALGSKKIFEKNGIKVAVTTYKDGFYLTAE